MKRLILAVVLAMVALGQKPKSAPSAKIPYYTYEDEPKPSMSKRFLAQPAEAAAQDTMPVMTLPMVRTGESVCALFVYMSEERHVWIADKSVVRALPCSLMLTKVTRTKSGWSVDSKDFHPNDTAGTDASFRSRGGYTLIGQVR